MTGRASLVRLRDGDIEAGIAERAPRGAEAARIAELAQDRDRGQLADPVVAHQRLAARLEARVGAQLTLDRLQLTPDLVDHPQRDVDLQPRRLGQLQALQPGAVVGGQKLPALRYTVVVQLRLDPLLPLR